MLKYQFLINEIHLPSSSPSQYLRVLRRRIQPDKTSDPNFSDHSNKEKKEINKIKDRKNH